MSHDVSSKEERKISFLPFFKRIFHFIYFPQYILFLLELLFFILFLLILIVAYSQNVVDINTLSVCVLINVIWLGFCIRRWYKLRNDILPDFRKQFTSNWNNYSTLRERMFFYLRSILIPIYISILSSFIDGAMEKNNLIVKGNFSEQLLKNQFQILLIVSSIIIFFEMPIRFMRKSPILFYSSVGLPILIVSNIGIDDGIFRWGFLSILMLTLGSNFFDKEYIEEKFRIDISKEKITDKKIKYLLIIVGLYLVLFFAEIIRSSNAFQLYIHNNSINCLGELLLIDLIKLIFLMLAIMLYITWNEVILYSIVRLFFSNNSSRLYGYYKKVIFDKKTKKWKVSSDLFLLVPNSNKGSLSLVDKHCQNLEYSLQDVHQILCDVVKIKCSFHNSSETKQENRYFVRYDSSIIKEIDGRIQDYGYRLLGAPIMGGWPAYLAIFILFVFGISSKTLIEKSFKIDGTYVNINTVREKNDKIAYTFNWDDCIQIDDNKFSYDGEVAQLEPNKLSFKTGNFYGNLKRNNLHIFDEVNKSDKLYIRIDSVPYANFLNKMLDDAKIETWFDVDEDGFLDQIKVRP